jgi:hypothetical protein
MARSSGFVWASIKRGCLPVNATQITMLFEWLLEWFLASEKRVKKPPQIAENPLYCLYFLMDCEIKKQSVSFRKTSSRETAVTMDLALALDPENESVRVAILAKQFALGLQEVADEVRTSPVNDDASSWMKTGSRLKPKRAIAP